MVAVDNTLRENNNNGRVARIRMPGEVALLITLIINSMGVDLMSKSGFGIAQISSVPYIFSKTLPSISFGTFNYIFQTMLVISLMIISRKIKLGYLFSFAVGIAFGFMLDVHNVWVAMLPSSSVLNALYFVASFLILCIGVAFANNSMLPIIPTDTFPRDLAAIINKPYNVVKTTFDCSCLLATVVISFIFLGHLDAVGIGTVICALSMGKVISLINKKMNMHIEFYRGIEREKLKRKLNFPVHLAPKM